MSTDPVIAQLIGDIKELQLGASAITNLLQRVDRLEAVNKRRQDAEREQVYRDRITELERQLQAAQRPPIVLGEDD